MLNRRKFVLTLIAGVAALGFVASVSVLADELLGVMTKVDVEGKKITVEEKGTDKEIVITITDETEQTKKGGGPRKSTSRSWRKVSRKPRTPARKGLTSK